jgi:DNA-binding phage protein
LEEEAKRPRAKTSKKLRQHGCSINLIKNRKDGDIMAITRNFRDTILKRAEKDAAFRRQMLIEAVNELLAGDLNAGKAMLRDYINATITFEGLAKKVRKSAKSLHRMLGSSGNPRADNILEIIKTLQEHEHITLSVKANRNAA